VAQVSIVDEARKVDINQLVNPRTGQPNPQYVGIVERLFASIGVSPDLLPAIIDWLRPRQYRIERGAEADYAAIRAAQWPDADAGGPEG
jgi:hypothetical protein